MSHHIRVTRAKQPRVTVCAAIAVPELANFITIILYAVLCYSKFTFLEIIIITRSHIVSTLCADSNAQQATKLSSYSLSVMYCCRYFGVAFL